VAEAVMAGEQQVAGDDADEQLVVRLPACPEDDQVGGDEGRQRDGVAARQAERPLLLGQSTSIGAVVTAAIQVIQPPV
jgi:hypothetical protein